MINLLLIPILFFAYPKISFSQTIKIIPSQSQSFDVLVGNTPQFITYPIVDQDGVSRYWLHCAAGNDTAMDALSSKTGINFVAPFACRLTEDAQTNSEQSLLTEAADTAYWHSRARFSLQSMQAPCSDDPVYGATRMFSLRGFELTLGIRDLKRAADNTEFTLQVQIRTDAAAQSNRAAPVKPSKVVPSNAGCDRATN